MNKKFTKSQLSCLETAIDLYNNDGNWYYFNDDFTEIIMRKPIGEDAWGKEQIITEEFIKNIPWFELLK